MPYRPLRLRARDSDEAARLRAGFAAIRTQLGVPGPFDEPTLSEALAEALAEASAVAGREGADQRADGTDVPFVTIDPPGSTDLDQALHIERRGAGYRVWYAIADAAAFVRPGGAVDAEAQRRGQTFYSPDRRSPLHPEVLSEGAASLLPEQVRPAVLWRLDLDSSGERIGTEVRRAVVRSRAQLSYEEAQAALGGSGPPEGLRLLAEVGRLREEREVARGGVSLPLPEQEIRQVDGSFRLAYREPLPVEGWNAQISLLTGMAAADVMVEGRVGVLRTLPPAPANLVARLRRVATALGVSWDGETTYAELIRRLDPANPQHVALMEEATILLRGAGYAAFDGVVPESARHSAVAAAYAHATAPLRRLVDRYVSETCLALCAGRDAPEWVRAALPSLPDLMADSDRKAGSLERECVALMEAAVLDDRVGEVFDAVVVEANGKSGTVLLRDPAVRASCDGDLPLGEWVRVRCTEVDLPKRRVRFALA